ncbi:MAG: hypothetical protein ACK5M7_04340 [Draconibacterium sp.]
MARIRILTALFLLFFLGNYASAQLMGFRFALNSGLLVTELGKSDALHPDALALTPATASETFTPQPTIGAEAEILFQISENAFFGIELDYTHLKGYNDNPPWYNYYLTPYFSEYQPVDYVYAPIKYNTTLFNLAVNYKYFFFKEKVLQPFVKLTGVVALVGTDLKYQGIPEFWGDGTVSVPDVPVIESDVLYARGTANSNLRKWPTFHFGGGIGFSYDISDHLAFQIDGTVTFLNSGIINGVPNFTYVQENNENILRYNRHLSLTTQISAGIAYTFEVNTGGKEVGGKIDPHFPFYRRKK